MKAVLLATLTFLSLGAQEIIPAPVRLEHRAGQFTLGAATRLVAAGEAAPIAERLAAGLRPATGLALPVSGKAGKDTITFVLDPMLPLGGEGYRLETGPDHVVIRAAKAAGLFYGAQTLRQMLPSASLRQAKVEGVAWTLPAAAIEDGPRFSWRGSHVDCCRHFMPMAALKKHLDTMALHKLNVFHWHLTDDQGWRLEIKKYPRLTQEGAWRKETVIGYTQNDGRPDLQRYDNTPHGGFYTQDDVREIVRYAADRFITVVPEIEMPGHAQAALAAYPELGNFPETKHEVLPYWGVSEAIFGVDDRTLTFLKDVLDEVLTLFPSTYIHVGGDESPKAEWSRSPRALARMKELGLVPATATLADLAITHDARGEEIVPPALHKLQAWFTTQFDAYLTAKGRRLIGWDEILEGGLAPGSTVMSWRGEAGGIAAAKAGHDVVMTPENICYLDHLQSRGPEPLALGDAVIDLAKVYGYEPVPPGLTEAEAKHVLGSQGNLWTEYIDTPQHLEYMAWPRLSALSEVFWSPKGARNLQDFNKRLKADQERLKVLGVNAWTGERHTLQSH
jgi:hexosaminidase